MPAEKLIEFKGQANLVTIADKKSEELIISGILGRYPSHSILAGIRLDPARRFREVDRSFGWDHELCPRLSVLLRLHCCRRGWRKLSAGAGPDPIREEMFSAAGEKRRVLQRRAAARVCGRPTVRGAPLPAFRITSGAAGNGSQSVPPVSRRKSGFATRWVGRARSLLCRCGPPRRVLGTLPSALGYRCRADRSGRGGRPSYRL